MEWQVPFIIYRISDDGILSEVFHAPDLKMAKYWLTYIAKTGDVLCKTPIHPKHSKSDAHPEYWSHKEFTGQPNSDLDAWQKYAERKHFDGKFPDEQINAKTE